MLSAFSNSLKIPELRSRIGFTVLLVFICRIIAIVPTPGVEVNALKSLIDEQRNNVGGGVMGLLDLFAGGAMSNCAIGALGIMPYISASIIIQLMTAIIPHLERLSREGDTGRQKIIQYTRYLTLGICLVQAFMWARSLETGALLGPNADVVMNPGLGFELMTVLTMTTACILLMWLGEQITDRGVGNGISLIITVNIIASLPAAAGQAIAMFQGNNEYGPFHLAALTIMIFLVIAATVAITQAVRKVPVQYAKRVVGNKVYGGGGNFMPLKVNYSGVMPIIFAQALMIIPTGMMQVLPWDWAKQFAAFFQMGGTAYMLTYAFMILFFSYFWVATQFKPVQIADDLKKSGGYIPGIRPGKPTADFLDRTMTRITLVGALAITVIAVIPTVMAMHFNIPWLVANFFGGTSLMIMVGVALDTMRQIESHLLTRHYDGFLKKGRIRGRR